MLSTGERNGQSKLTELDIINILRRYAAGETSQQELAKEYNISQPHVSRIINRKAWSHVNANIGVQADGSVEQE